jgi:hypothetical protein
MSNFLDTFADLIYDIAIKEASHTTTGYGRIEETYIERTIKGTIQAISLYGKSRDMTTTINDGDIFTIGQILLITNEKLKTIQENKNFYDIVLWDGQEYKITTRALYNTLIPHYEYMCQKKN